mmetsp:Transcript_25078/g.63589  ORF Transcript_25078/g.63589 Transcript_25078/m.63589 type:complete len:383 (-) Transcript_25078:41-1189(-)
MVSLARVSRKSRLDSSAMCSAWTAVTRCSHLMMICRHSRLMPSVLVLSCAHLSFQLAMSARSCCSSSPSSSTLDLRKSACSVAAFSDASSSLRASTLPSSSSSCWASACSTLRSNTGCAAAAAGLRAVLGMDGGLDSKPGTPAGTPDAPTPGMLPPFAAAALAMALIACTACASLRLFSSLSALTSCSCCCLSACSCASAAAARVDSTCASCAALSRRTLSVCAASLASSASRRLRENARRVVWYSACAKESSAPRISWKMCSTFSLTPCVKALRTDSTGLSSKVLIEATSRMASECRAYTLSANSRPRASMDAAWLRHRLCMPAKVVLHTWAATWSALVKSISTPALSLPVSAGSSMYSPPFEPGWPCWLGISRRGTCILC